MDNLTLVHDSHELIADICHFKRQNKRDFTPLERRTLKILKLWVEQDKK